jgi:hypothetical protein
MPPLSGAVRLNVHVHNASVISPIYHYRAPKLDSGTTRNEDGSSPDLHCLSNALLHGIALI